MQFQKFKRRALGIALIKSASYALSLGTALFALLYLLLKRALIDMNVLTAVLIGVGAALLCFGALFFLLIKKGKIIAFLALFTNS